MYINVCISLSLSLYIYIYSVCVRILFRGSSLSHVVQLSLIHVFDVFSSLGTHEVEHGKTLSAFLRPTKRKLCVRLYFMV